MGNVDLLTGESRNQKIDLRNIGLVAVKLKMVER